MAKVHSRVCKIDEDLAKRIEEIAKANEISFRQASKEYAKISDIIKLSDKKFLKEIRF
jgi:hypothetical protein